MSTSERKHHIAFVIVLFGALSASFHTTFADTGEFRATGAMTISGHSHTATLLRNGQVLIAGDVSDSGFLDDAELYDLTTETFIPTDSLVAPRARVTPRPRSTMVAS